MYCETYNARFILSLGNVLKRYQNAILRGGLNYDYRSGVDYLRVSVETLSRSACLLLLLIYAYTYNENK